jgi:putative transposase
LIETQKHLFAYRVHLKKGLFKDVDREDFGRPTDVDDNFILAHRKAQEAVDPVEFVNHNIAHRGPPALAGGGMCAASPAKIRRYFVAVCMLWFVARYRKNAGATFALKYHLVWCPKYRRPVLDVKIAARLEEILRETCDQLEVEILALEIMPDHVHLFISSDPRWAVAGLMARLKGGSSKILREEFPSLRSRLPTLWSRSYYAGTVGHVSEATVRQYIKEQKGR